MQRVRLYAIITLLLILSSCHFAGRERDARTEEEFRSYQALTDSMQRKPTETLPLIVRKMAEAQDSLTWYDYYLMYGRHYLLTAHPDSLLPYATRTLHFARNRQPQTQRLRGLAATALNAMAAYHYLLHHNTDTIATLYGEAYRLLSESDMKSSLPDVSANMADAYVAKGNLAEGSRWYRRALFLADSLALPKQQTLSLYLGLGRIYTNIGDYEEARHYYERAERDFDKLKPNMQSYFLNNYGNYFYYQHRYQEALETFKRLKAHLEKLHAEQNFDMYLCKINMADVLQNLGQTDSARHYVQEAEDYFREQGVGVGVYYAHTIRIGIALQEKRYADVEKILQEEGQPTDIEPEMQYIRSEYLDRYYAAIGNYQRAYATLQDNRVHQDSANSSQRRLRSEDVMMRLTEDTIRLHHQIEMNLQQAKYDKTRLTLWAIVATFIVMVLGITLRYSYERKRNLKNMLDMQNLRLSNARQRISPHFVFNVLNSRINKSSQQESDQLMTLAKLIRSNLDLTSKTYVTLAEELDFVRQYIEVERQLLGEDFSYRMELPEREILEQVKMPSMLVQIMTENAILHGLKGREGEKKLCISVETDKQEVRIIVSDNGPGFDIRHYNSQRCRTGLNIIRTTLNTINQENKKAKMHFDIVNNQGCQAILTIPKQIRLL